MEIVLGIFLYTCVILVVMLSVMVIAMTNDTVYTFIFEHEDFVLWKEYIRNADKFVSDYYTTLYGKKVYHFVNDTGDEAVVWGNGYCSIHKGENMGCVLSTFYRKASLKMAKILMEKVNDNIIAKG